MNVVGKDYLRIDPVEMLAQVEVGVFGLVVVGVAVFVLMDFPRRRSLSVLNFAFCTSMAID